MATPAIGNLQGSHQLEVVAATREGYIFAWQTAGSDRGVIEWASYHHDNANSGNYATSFDQGVLEHAKHPIDCATDCPQVAGPPMAAIPQYEPVGGGCSVRGLAKGKGSGGDVTAVPDGEGGAWLPAIGLAVAAAARRRRKSGLYRIGGADHTARPSAPGSEGASLPE